MSSGSINISDYPKSWELLGNDNENPNRLSLSWDPDMRLATIQDENLDEDGEVDGIRGAIDLTQAEAKWLHKRLGEMLRIKDQVTSLPLAEEELG